MCHAANISLAIAFTAPTVTGALLTANWSHFPLLIPFMAAEQLQRLAITYSGVTNPMGGP